MGKHRLVNFKADPQEWQRFMLLAESEGRTARYGAAGDTEE